MNRPDAGLSKSSAHSPAFGRLLKRHRAVNGMSQIALASEAGVSTRHLSFLESGRSRPSRDMVLRLAQTLDTPLRESNQLLLAAGFAPFYSESDFQSREMENYRQLVDKLLQAFEPFGAVAMDGEWRILSANAAHWRALAAFGVDIEDETLSGDMLALLFSSAGLRPHITNFEEVARHVLNRVHRETLDAADREPAAVLNALIEKYDLPRDWRGHDPEASLDLATPVRLTLGAHELRLITTITRLGAAQDVTLEELRIEAFLPADDQSETMIRALAG